MISGTTTQRPRRGAPPAKPWMPLHRTSSLLGPCWPLSERNPRRRRRRRRLLRKSLVASPVPVKASGKGEVSVATTTTMGKVVGTARSGVAVFPPGAVPPPSAASRPTSLPTADFHGATDVLVLHRASMLRLDGPRYDVPRETVFPECSKAIRIDLLGPSSHVLGSSQLPYPSTNSCHPYPLIPEICLYSIRYSDSI
ncbi:hypothetical protein BC826DRAFT_1024973 [Russula brevipes]|nr:hypothetical protein BC826DRAFT_1024973 [Russula brevipes]